MTDFKEGRQAYAATVGKENESDSEIDESSFLKLKAFRTDFNIIGRLNGIFKL